MFRWFLAATICVGVNSAAASMDAVSEQLILNCPSVSLEDIRRIQVVLRGGVSYLVLNQRDGQIETMLSPSNPCVSIPTKITLPPWQGMLRTLEYKSIGWAIQICGPVSCDLISVNCR